MTSPFPSEIQWFVLTRNTAFGRTASPLDFYLTMAENDCNDVVLCVNFPRANQPIQLERIVKWFSHKTLKYFCNDVNNVVVITVGIDV